jgi:hypothetical protein
MAYSTINKSSAHFNTKLYTGNGSTQSITGVGFQPDFTWIKRRDGTYNHYLCDAPRGAGKYLKSNQTSGETDGSADHLTAWTSDGFNLGGTAGVNLDTATFASWNWKAGTTSGLTGGTITPSSYSYNATSGFGIYKWTGTGATGTITHGLGSTPKMMIIKVYDHDENWIVYDSTNGATNFTRLNQTNATGTNSTMFNDTEPTDTLFTIGSHDAVNKSGNLCIAYVFADVAGYSKFSSYKGNANNDGTFVYTGFKPAWIMIKNTSASSSETGWYIYDNKRGGPAAGVYGNNNKYYLLAESNVVEGNESFDLLSNGFKCRITNNFQNGSGNTLIYMAFAEFPIVSSNDIPCTAR